MRGEVIALSRPRRLICDLLALAASVPGVPVQRRMNLSEVMTARAAVTGRRPPWAALFIKAYARTAEAMPELRRAYVKLPWPRLYQYPTSVASLAVERTYEGSPAVFFGQISDPARLPLEELTKRIRHYTNSPVPKVTAFRRALRLSAWPTPIRRLAWWLGLNLGRQRARYFGTFGLTVYSGLGAESLHPLSPLSTTLTYGVIAADGTVDVRIVYDHRVMDGATVARALARLEREMNESVAAELRGMSGPRKRLLLAM